MIFGLFLIWFFGACFVFAAKKYKKKKTAVKLAVKVFFILLPAAIAIIICSFRGWF